MRMPLIYLILVFLRANLYLHACSRNIVTLLPLAVSYNQ